MYNLARALFQRNIEDWKIEDIHTPNSSDGTSVLLSAFVDQAATILNPDMTPDQSLTPAHIAARTAPKRLLDMLQDLRWALDSTTTLPPLLEDELCPIRTPGLFTPDENHAINTDYPLRSDQIHSVEIFLQCFYPRITPIARTHLNQLEAHILTLYVQVPGEAKRSMTQANYKMIFSLPNWYRLSTQPNRVLQSTPRKEVTREDQWNTIPIRLQDIQLKLDVPLQELRQQSFEAQRTTLLSTISLIFQDRVNREGRLETISLIARATPEELSRFLNCHTDRGCEEANTSQPALPTASPVKQQYLHCMRFEHTARRISGEGTKSMESILFAWIKGVRPVLAANNLNLILSVSPFA